MRRKEKKFHGVIIPMVTPFTEKGALDEAAALRIAEHIVDAGTYPFLLGTTGESASVSLETRLRFVKCVVKYLGGRTLIYAGISDNCLENSIHAAKQYHDCDVDAFVAHLPSYYPLTPDHIRKYYETLAANSPGPIIIYNIPITTHMSIPLDVIAKLSHHPNIVGMKDSERDLDRLRTSAEMFAEREDFSLLCGWSAQAANALLLGYDGIIPNPGNLVPKMYRDLYDAAVCENKDAADELQTKTDAIVKVFQSNQMLSQTIAALKVMMSELDLCGPWVLPPLCETDATEGARIKKNMAELGLTPKVS